MKKGVFLIALFAILLAPCIAFATTYNSYLVLPAGNQVNGSTRTYDNPKHKVTITADGVETTDAPLIVIITLNKKNLICSTQQKRVSQSFTLGSTFTTVMGNYGSGKKWYGFGSHSKAYLGNDGVGTWYSGLYSDSVKMISYD